MNRMRALQVFPTDTHAFRKIATDHGMQGFYSIAAVMSRVVNRTSMHVVRIHGGVFTIHFFGDDDFSVSPSVNDSPNGGRQDRQHQTKVDAKFEDI